MTKACEVPDGETTDPTEREENWVGPATYDFIVHVNGPSSPDNNLSGRFYRETDYQPAIDACWVEGDPPEFRVTGVTNPNPITLNLTNSYADRIGMPTLAIDYYRSENRTPCSSFVYARMQITVAKKVLVTRLRG